jgi:hypothetical protein
VSKQISTRSTASAFDTGTGDFIGTDVIATGHTYPAGSTVGSIDNMCRRDLAQLGVALSLVCRRNTMALPATIVAKPAISARNGDHPVEANAFRVRLIGARFDRVRARLRLAGVLVLRPTTVSGHELRELLERAGLTQVGAAVALGIDARTMRRYLHASRRHVPRVIEYAVRYIVEHKPQA